MIDLERKERYQKVIDLAGIKLRRLLEKYPDQMPEFTVGGKWVLTKNPWTNWCEGFLGGQLWLMHDQTGDSWWEEQAINYALLIEDRNTDRAVHDLGFLFWPTWKYWYDLTGDEDINDTVVTAGETLGLRFQEKGKYLCSFMGKESLFIDIMMNVGIIFYAALETGREDLWQAALQHCLTTRRVLVRGDGSTAHEGIFDTQTGAFLRQSTQQGWRDDSCWARGLAWALYGFGTVYEFTLDLRFLETAELIASYYIEQTPLHGIPPNDWDEPTPTYSYESSAAAIAAGGFLNLSSLTGDRTRATLYRQYALQILDTLSTPAFTALDDSEYEGILKHGIYHLNKGLGVDESVMWGEYFFLQALTRVLNEN